MYLAQIIANKINTLSVDDILVVVYLHSEDIFILKIMKESMYIPNTAIWEIGPFTRNFSYTDILRVLDYHVEKGLRLLDYNIELGFKSN